MNWSHVKDIPSSKQTCDIERNETNVGNGRTTSAKGGYSGRNTWEVAGMAWAQGDGGGYAWAWAWA